MTGVALGGGTAGRGRLSGSGTLKELPEVGLAGVGLTARGMAEAAGFFLVWSSVIELGLQQHSVN